MIIRRAKYGSLYLTRRYMWSINYYKSGIRLQNQNLGGFEELNRILKIK